MYIFLTRPYFFSEQIPSVFKTRILARLAEAGQFTPPYKVSVILTVIHPSSARADRKAGPGPHSDCICSRWNRDKISHMCGDGCRCLDSCVVSAERNGVSVNHSTASDRQTCHSFFKKNRKVVKRFGRIWQ